MALVDTLHDRIQYDQEGQKLQSVEKEQLLCIKISPDGFIIGPEIEGQHYTPIYEICCV